ncbi:hypothetical protein F2Q68_00042250 [Brassica cretica]|uniref:Mannosyltransferase n=2 Tax=Brassica cretica TaxID=69181 RepID=A0A8S9MAT1_BRACR|nr:hypothetical protein F2Q68_00042250 [Brassica cretica]
MDLTTTRQRRPLLTGSSSSSPKPYSKTDKPGRSDGGDAEDRGLGWFLPFIALCYLRYMSATSNIVHDCDEVFNYWEPLHYLLYKSGFQTWEYSSKFALRSYLYIIFHELAGRPAAWWFGDDKVSHLLCISLVIFFVFSVNVVSEEDYQRVVPPEDKTSTVWLSRIKQSGNDYWAKLKESLGRGHARFFPPNIDFRGKDDASMGAGGKMKEAVTRSFEHSKDTVEEAARSAAEVTCDAAEAVKEKVKRSFSGSETTQQQSDEL